MCLVYSICHFFIPSSLFWSHAGWGCLLSQQLTGTKVWKDKPQHRDYYIIYGDSWEIAGSQRSSRIQTGTELKYLKQSTEVLWLHCQLLSTQPGDHGLCLWTTEPSLLHTPVLDKCLLMCLLQFWHKQNIHRAKSLPFSVSSDWKPGFKKVKCVPTVLGIREKRVWIQTFLYSKFIISP